MTQEPPPWGQQPQYPPVTPQPPFQQQSPVPQYPAYGGQGYGQQLPPGPPVPPQPRSPKPLYKRAWFLIAAGVVALIVVLGVVGAATGSGDKKKGADKKTAAPATTSAQETTATTSSAAPTTSAPPTPTPTPTQPTTTAPPPSFAQQDYSGSGDQIVTLAPLSSPGVPVLAINYSGARNFVVQTLDASGSTQALLVNAIGAFSGRVLVTGDWPAALQVQSSGDWTVSAVDLTTQAPWDPASGPATGTGDDVIYVQPGAVTGLFAATFTHDGQRNFVVKAYATDGQPHLLINDIGAYTGQVLLPSGTLVITITADGNWTGTPS
jgi:hypothetical protein